MVSIPRAVLVAKAIVISSLLCAGLAHAFELDGSWATDPDQCDRVFTKKGDGVTFSETSDLYGSGFVVDGKKVIGKTARCTINSMKQNGSTVNFLASCATEIMFQNI